LTSFVEPNLAATGSTALGEALTLLEQCLGREVRKSAPGQKGDWKPLVFLMTDGQPTDTWDAAADRIKKKRVANIIPAPPGPAPDAGLLKRITEPVVELSNPQPDQLKAFFKWVSSSIRTASQKIDLTPIEGGAGPGGLPPPPAGSGIVIVP